MYSGILSTLKKQFNEILEEERELGYQKGYIEAISAFI